MLALGTLSAPVGTVTIVFASVVGAAQLLTDIPQAAREALSVFQVRRGRMHSWEKAGGHL